MSTKQKMKKIIFAALFIFVLGILSLMPLTQNTFATNHGCETDTSIIDCNAAGNSVNTTGDLQNSGLWSILLIAIQIISAGVGVAALAGIVYGVILYTTSGGDPSGLKKALEVIRNVVIGVVAYALMWSALNWLIPGGVFN
jgi:hypothetical protein